MWRPCKLFIIVTPWQVKLGAYWNRNFLVVKGLAELLPVKIENFSSLCIGVPALAVLGRICHLTLELEKSPSPPLSMERVEWGKDRMKFPYLNQILKGKWLKQALSQFTSTLSMCMVAVRIQDTAKGSATPGYIWPWIRMVSRSECLLKQAPVQIVRRLTAYWG